MTQRDSDFQDVEGSVVLARAWLQSKSMTVKRFYSHWIHTGGKSGLKGSLPKDGSVRDIAKFISKQGKTISRWESFLP